MQENSYDGLGVGAGVPYRPYLGDFPFFQTFFLFFQNKKGEKTEKAKGGTKGKLFVKNFF